jgi:hypothetical protein
MAKDHTISRRDANDEIRQFLKIRAEIFDSIDIDELSDAAGKFLSSDLVSFVFYKDQLDALFATVSANTYRVYLAADAYGYPTLVVIPCQLSADETSMHNVLSASEGPGQQYPVPSSTGSTFDGFDIGDE